MAGHFKKRRGASGPNKNEEKVQRGKSDEVRTFGMLGARYPFVKHLKIDLTFLDMLGNPLDTKHMSLGPTDAANFKVACPGRCGRGSFEFGVKIADSVAARLPVVEASGKCSEPMYPGSAEACGCQAKCRLEFDYVPVPPPSPAPAPSESPS